MKDFFTFYTDIEAMSMPFVTFDFTHLFFLLSSAAAIIFFYRRYCALDEAGRQSFQRRMGIYFLAEELIYTLWLLLFCHEQVWLQLLPLELCSLCAYIGALAAFTQKRCFCFFSAVTGLFAGTIAMLYPANLSQLYPFLSYRTINFYMLHASFVLFALLQLKQRELLTWRNAKVNLLLVCFLFSIAFFVNLHLHTQYMFIGVPPQIGGIRLVYQVSGIFFFLPAVFIFMGALQTIQVALMRKLLLKRRRRI